MSRIKIYTVYLLCSGLNNEDERQSAPLTETLHCTSTRRISPRYAGETGTKKPPNQPRRMAQNVTRLAALAALVSQWAYLREGRR